MNRLDAQKLIESYWGPRARASEAAHYRVATRYAWWNQAFSLIIVVGAAATGSALLATLSHDTRWHIAIAIVSLFTALVGAVQRSLQYSRRSVQHQAAGADWSPIVSVTEELSEKLKYRDPKTTEIDDLRAQMDAVTKKSPQIPNRVFRRFKLAETYMYSLEHRYP